MAEQQQQQQEQKREERKIMNPQQKNEAKSVLRHFAHHELGEEQAKQRLKDLNMDEGKIGEAFSALRDRKKSLSEINLEMEMTPGTLRPGQPAVIHSPGHGLMQGDTVSLEEFESKPSINGARQVNVLDGDHFTVGTHVQEVQKAEGTWVKGQQHPATRMAGGSGKGSPQGDRPNLERHDNFGLASTPGHTEPGSPGYVRPGQYESGQPGQSGQPVQPGQQNYAPPDATKPKPGDGL